MDQSEAALRIAFVINLGPRDSQQVDPSRLHHLIHLFRGHRVPATWAVGDGTRAELLNGGEPTLPDELALLIDRRQSCLEISVARFRDELATQVASIRQASGMEATLIVGEPESLRSKVSLLAEQGMRAIVATGSRQKAGATPRPLPLGLWNFTPTIEIPQGHRLSRLLPVRRPSVKQLMGAKISSGGVLVAIETSQLDQLGPRGARQIEKLVRDVAWAASREQVVVATVGELVTELAGAAVAQPQRSILSAAA